MFAVRKILLSKDVIKLTHIFGKSRPLHLTYAENSDPFVVRSSEEIVIPDVTISEVILPKFEVFKRYTAVVSNKIIFKLNIFMCVRNSYL